MTRLSFAICMAALSTACLSTVGPGGTFLCDPITGEDCDAGSPDGGAPFVTAPHSAWPELAGGSGSVMASPRLVAIAASNDLVSQNLFDFVDTIVASDWMSQVGSGYGVGSATSGGQFIGPPLADADGGTDITWSEAQSYVQQVVGAGAPAPDGRTIYVVFLPPGFTTIDGHHWIVSWDRYPATGSAGDLALLVPRSTPLSGESQFDEVTRTTTRYLMSLLTDPPSPPGPGWSLPEATPPWQSEPAAALFASQPTMAGDLCMDNRVEDAGAQSTYAFARIWSNTAAALGGDPCLPSSSQPYYNVSFPQTWYAVSAGQSVSIPFVGWTTAPAGDWGVYAGFSRAQGGFSTPTLTSARLAISTSLGEEQIGNCNPLPGVNNNVSGTIQFTVPDAVVSGDYGVINIDSVYLDPQGCSDPPASQGDAKHHNFVGVYVP